VQLGTDSEAVAAKVYLRVMTRHVWVDSCGLTMPVVLYVYCSGVCSESAAEWKTLCLSWLPNCPRFIAGPHLLYEPKQLLYALRGFEELLEDSCAAVGHQVPARGGESDDMLDSLEGLAALAGVQY
jgi:hypothetical protein